jgi:electron transport complex protein RnfE
MKWINEFTKGFIKENQIFVYVLGLCPTLAVTTSLMNGLGMGIAVTFVLMCSNIIISCVKDLIPNKVRIPCYIVVIAAFTTVIELLIEAYVPFLHKSLGIFIPLIAVNCIIFARAESFASRNNVSLSVLDGLGMGLGFTGALVLIGSIREMLGTGRVLEFGNYMGISVFPEAYQQEPMLFFILAPGAFITLGVLLAMINILKIKKTGRC